MFNLLGKIALVFTGITTFVGGLLFPVINPPTQIQNNVYGSFIPVQAPKTKLSGSGVSASANTIILQTLKLADASTTIVMTDLGTTGYGTLEPGTAREEQISFTGITQNADGTATLSGVTRGLDFKGANCAAVTGFQKAHAGGTIFILSNTACFYANELTPKNSTATITGSWSFSSSTNVAPKYADSINLNGLTTSTLAHLDYVNSVASSGAANATALVKGIVQLATAAQVASGTALGSTGSSLVAPTTLTSATSATAGIIPVVQDANGLNKIFINQTSSYNWTNNHTFNATTTFAAGVQINASSSINASTTLTANLIGAGFIPLLASSVVSSTADFTTTSSAQFTTFATTTMTLVAAHRVLLTFTGAVANTGANTVYMNFAVDGKNVASGSNGITKFDITSANLYQNASMSYVTDTLTAASHAFSVLVSEQANSSSTVSGSNPIWKFNVIELYN